MRAVSQLKLLGVFQPYEFEPFTGFEWLGAFSQGWSIPLIAEDGRGKAWLC